MLWACPLQLGSQNRTSPQKRNMWQGNQSEELFQCIDCRTKAISYNAVDGLLAWINDCTHTGCSGREWPGLGDGREQIEPSKGTRMRGMDFAGRRGGRRGSGRLGDGWGAVVIGSGGQWASRRWRAVGRRWDGGAMVVVGGDSAV
jgi:hypothetical protein